MYATRELFTNRSLLSLVRTGKVQKRFRFMENVPLNESRSEKLVNVVFYEEIDAKGVKRR